MANQPARQIGKAKLLGLVKAIDGCNSRIGNERQALGAKFEAAATSDNFNAKALKPLLPLLKMEAGPQAHLWRTMMLYASHLGIGAQGDLEDYAQGQRAGEEDDEDGDNGDNGDGDEREAGEGNVDDARELAEEAAGGEADVMDSLLDMDTPALGRFRAAMDASLTAEAVNKGLERFTEDHPSSADEALEIAQARLEAINLDQSGGEEDVRPASLRDAAKLEAEQVAEAAKATAPKTPRKRAARTDAPRPESPAARSARDNGIGDDFGQATKH